MSGIDIECEAGWLLRDFERSPAARQLVAHHLGPDAIVRVTRIVGGVDAGLVQLHGRHVIAVRSKLSREAFRWALLHELAEWHLAEHVRYEEPDVELVAEALTAALVMPRVEFRAAAPATAKLTLLARHFFTSETAVALRIGEVTDTAAVVVAPTHIRARGEDFVWPAEPELRRLAKTRRLPPGLARITLRDDRRRRALLAG